MDVQADKRRIQAANTNVPIILVVEDDRDNLLFICHTLIFFQHNFIVATEAKTAVDLASNYSIDLILLDLVLPDANGFDLVRTLKQDKLTKDIPIIAITALAKEQDLERALAAGCDDYLSKPYLIDDLNEKIRSLLPQYFFKYEPKSFFRYEPIAIGL